MIFHTRWLCIRTPRLAPQRLRKLTTNIGALGGAPARSAANDSCELE